MQIRGKSFKKKSVHGLYRKTLSLPCPHKGGEFKKKKKKVPCGLPVFSLNLQINDNLRINNYLKEVPKPSKRP